VTILFSQGGKREKLESPQVTACRELFEETGALLDPNIIESLIRILTHSNQPLPQDQASDFSVGWVEYGRYVLYMLPVTQVPQLAA
jgi:8-oxo-dGTP pyrophosphatase MutT (NUDIX family)